MQRFNHVAGMSLQLYGRVKKPDGTWGTKSNVSSIATKVRRVGEESSSAGTLTVANVMFDTLQTDDLNYTPDVNDARIESGYNFAWTVPAASFPAADWYYLEARFTFSDGAITTLQFQGPAREALS